MTKRLPILERLGIAIFAFSIVATVLAPTRSEAFSDVDGHAFYGEAVEWVEGEGIVRGRTSEVFDPLAAVTRAEFATMLWRFAGSPKADSAATFIDVQPGSFYESAVWWMSEAEITTGRSTSVFDPGATVTRAEVATFLWRYVCRPMPVDPNSFDDVEPGRFYELAVRWMHEVGLTTGNTPSTFAPHDTASRGDSATFLWRLAGLPPPGSFGLNRTTSAPSCVRSASACDGTIVSEAGLNLAIDCINSITQPGPVALVVDAAIDLTAPTRVISNSTPGVVVTFLGRGHAIDAQDTAGVRPLTIIGGPVVILADLTLEGGNIGEGPTGGGGGLFIRDARVILVRTTVSHNSALTDGGGIHVEGGVLSLVESTIADNGYGGGNGESLRGGGIYGDDTARIEAESSSITGNAASLGGGIMSLGEVVIIESTISGNSSSFAGGGIFVVDSGSVTRSTISTNRANVGGGVVFEARQPNAVFTISNSTITGNLSEATGAGVTMNGEGDLMIRNSTITGNDGGDGAGGLAHRSLSIGGAVMIANTIVGDQLRGPDCEGPAVSAGHNIDSDGSCFFAGPGDLTSAAIALGPLSPNGGRTLTHVPKSGSPAIDSGDPSICSNAPVGGIDQRSALRGPGSCAVGAVER